jgi:hypothetical protein
MRVDELTERQTEPNGVRLRKYLPGFAAGCIVLFAMIQVAPGHRLTNPRINRSETIEANLHIPAPVSALLHRACMNCHSNETRWPWYSRIAPVSWMMTHDVENARRAVNFSRWSIQNGSRPELAVATLAAACADLRSGRMPKWDYRLLHPDAQVPPMEVDQFCAWTRNEIHQLMEAKRQKRPKFTKLLQSANDLHPAPSVPLLQNTNKGANNDSTQQAETDR